jgi:hypothetical protein
MKIKEVKVGDITYTVRGKTDKIIKETIKGLKKLNKKTKQDPNDNDDNELLCEGYNK